MKIGIATISFNQGDFLEEAIKSVSLKNEADLEYVIVDPGSTDNSRLIIDNYRGKFHSIILEKDLGPADGLNKAFSRFEDVDVFGYLNADDVYVHGALDFVLDFFDLNPEVDVLTGAIGIIDKYGNRRLRKRAADKFSLKDYAFGICSIGQQATFFRKSAFKRTNGFNNMNLTCWDGELLVDLALSGSKFSVVNKILGDWRVYQGTITDNIRAKNDNLFSKNYILDRERIKSKIKESGIQLYPKSLEGLLIFLYKINLKRHFRYLYVN
jgi:glycosyltransferase involved in cell wall biosynthesis